MHLQTTRLILRPWQDADRHPFAAMSADPDVMRHLNKLPTRDAADTWIDWQIAHQAQHGFCFWAVAARPSGTFLGSVGLSGVSYPSPFTPAVQVGWRLARHAWGQGYASEAAEEALRFGFGHLGMAGLVANTVADNAASQRVMRTLGMIHDPADDFDHPRLPADDPLRRQILYRLSRKMWQARSKPAPI